MMVEAASPGASRRASAAALLRCMEASKLFLRGREDGTSESCVGDAEGIAEEEWALKLGVFPVPCCCSFFLGSWRNLLLTRP